MIRICALKNPSWLFFLGSAHAAHPIHARERFDLVQAARSDLRIVTHALLRNREGQLNAHCLDRRVYAWLFAGSALGQAELTVRDALAGTGDTVKPAKHAVGLGASGLAEASQSGSAFPKSPRCEADGRHHPTQHVVTRAAMIAPQYPLQDFMPLTALPLVARMMSEHLADLRVAHHKLQAARSQQHGLGAGALDHVISVCTESQGYQPFLYAQLDRWLTQRPTAGQCAAIEQIRCDAQETDVLLSEVLMAALELSAR